MCVCVRERERENIYIYIYIYIYMYIYIYIGVWSKMQQDISIYAHTHIRRTKHSCNVTNVVRHGTYIHICMHAYIHTCIHTCMHTYAGPKTATTHLLQSSRERRKAVIVREMEQQDACPRVVMPMSMFVVAYEVGMCTRVCMYACMCLCMRAVTSRNMPVVVYEVGMYMLVCVYVSVYMNKSHDHHEHVCDCL